MVIIFNRKVLVYVHCKVLKVCRIAGPYSHPHFSNANSGNHERVVAIYGVCRAHRLLAFLDPVQMMTFMPTLNGADQYP